MMNFGYNRVILTKKNFFSALDNFSNSSLDTQLENKKLD